MKMKTNYLIELLKNKKNWHFQAPGRSRESGNHVVKLQIIGCYSMSTYVWIWAERALMEI